MQLDMILNLGITIKIFLLMLLVADTQLCKRLCPSGSVKMLINDAAVMFACVCVSMGWGGYGWGLYAPAHPYATVL